MPQRRNGAVTLATVRYLAPPCSKVVRVFESTRKRWGVPKEIFASMIGVGPGSYYAWIAGRRNPSAPVKRIAWILSHYPIDLEAWLHWK